MLTRKIKDYQSCDLIVFGANFFTEGGDWKSIYLYSRESEFAGKKTKVILADKKHWLRKWLFASLFGRRILVNCIAALSSPFVIITCLVRKDVVIYLHATGHALDDFKRSRPLRFVALKWIMKRNRICCVSEQALQFYKVQFNANRLFVVYEYPGTELTLESQSRRLQVMMCGSINQRKGAELYSHVADIAASNGVDVDFHWIGGIATQDTIYLSPEVRWHGFTPNPHSMLAQCDIFFLSSKDDPCPLAALEALRLGKKTIAFHGTGISELIKDLPGCHVFPEHSPDSAYESLLSAMQDKPDPEAIKKGISQLISYNEFNRRLENAFMDSR
jgi:glycosyltransferase involved in cell wall biosynthesis